MDSETRKYRMAYRGFPAEYSRTRGATLPVSVTRKETMMPTDADQTLPPFPEDDVTALLRVAYPVPHVLN
eukprot:8027079-Karenia_brevis.AAC.1